MDPESIEKFITMTRGYSGADLHSLTSEAALIPIREIDISKLQSITKSEIRALTITDYERAMMRQKPTVNQNDIA